MRQIATRLLKRWYHEHVTNVRYAAISLTTVRRVQSFAISERFVTFSLVTSRMWREGGRRYNLSNVADLVVILPL